MTTFATYLATVTDGADQAAISHAWEIAVAAAPDAVEGTSYGMPALKAHGSPLFAVQATKKHLSIYPFSPPVLDALADRLAEFTRSKGSVQFSADRPVPDDVIVEMVHLRAAEIGG